MNRAALAARASRELARTVRAAAAQRLLRTRESATVTVVGEARMLALNSRYRGKRKPTDVLSFPSPDAIRAATGFLGELVICAPVLRRQARERGHKHADELLVLLVHGLLHLAGFDHERSAREAREMAGKEARLLQRLSRRADRTSAGLIARAR